MTVSQPENVPDVLNSLLTTLVVALPEGAGDQLLFLVLNLQHLFLDTGEEQKMKFRFGRIN